MLPELAEHTDLTGWLIAQGTTVAHYFEDGRSRCGRWLLTVLDTPETTESMRCAPCVEGVATDKHERERAAAATGETPERHEGDA